MEKEAFLTLEGHGLDLSQKAGTRPPPHLVLSSHLIEQLGELFLTLARKVGVSKGEKVSQQMLSS